MAKVVAIDQDYMACAFDPAYFFEYIYGFKPDPWQAEFLRDDKSTRIQFICTRQGGKSTTVAAKALHTAIFMPNSEILIISRRLKQAQETYRKVKVGYRIAKKFCKNKTKNTRDLELVNNSRIISLPGDGDNIRSYSGVTMLIIDEASRVADEVYQAVKPMLAVSGGALVLLSTPFGQRGFFYKRFLEPEHWKQVIITCDEVARIPESHLEDERREHGNRFVRQEYYCEFTASEDQLFSHETIMRAISSNIPALALPDPRAYF